MLELQPRQTFVLPLVDGDGVVGMASDRDPLHPRPRGALSTAPERNVVGRPVDGAPQVPALVPSD